MFKNQGNTLLVFGGLALLFFFPLALPREYHVDETVSPFFETFPTQIGSWVGEDSEVDETTYEILETRNVLSRTYSKEGGEIVHLLLVSSQSDRRVAHPPEVCYVASNYEILDEKEYEVTLDDRSVPVKEFLARSERDHRDNQTVLYLYKVGDQFTTSYYSQQIRFAVDRLSQKESEVFLIRIAGQSKPDMEAFLSKIVTILENKSQ